MDQTSYIEISKSAYNHNIKYLRNTIGSDIRFSSVVKGNAYGHGVDIIVPLAEKAKINHFSVFSASEALDVFNAASPKSDIMIMGYLSDDQLAWAIEKNIEFYIFNVERLQKAIDLAKAIKKPARIHIEVETGFNRTGIEYENMSEVVNLITDNQKHLILEGLCTHYAGAESVTNYYRIINQIKDYRRFYQYLTRHNLKPRFRHNAG